MSTAKVEVYTNLYKNTFKSTSELAEKVGEDRRLKQLGEGKGHPLWYIGHLAMSTDVIVNQWFLGGGSVVPPEYTAKFAPSIMGGGPVSPTASDYPPWDEVIANYNKACDATIELLSALSDNDIDSDLKGDVPEQARSFFGNLAGSLLSMAAHDSHHRGQIAQINALD